MFSLLQMGAYKYARIRASVWALNTHFVKVLWMLVTGIQY